MKMLGLVLIGLGVVALIYGGITYNKQHTVLDVGGIKASVTEKKTLPISPILGVVALVAGAAMVAAGSRKG